MSKIKQAVKKTGRGRKEVIVAELVQKIDSTNGLVFTDYKGISHINLETLKRNLKKQDSTMVIAKNSLLRISLGKSQKYADFKDNEGLDLPTATLLIRGDMVEPLKILQKAIKESGLPKIKFGILEGQLLDENGVLKIASLPNRETLLTQFVGTLNSPIQGLVVTLNGTIQKFVMTLDAVAKTKPAEATAKPEGEMQNEDSAEMQENTPAGAASTSAVPTEETTKVATEVQDAIPAKPEGEVATEMQSNNSAAVQEVKTNETTPEEANASEATPEVAVPANEPAVQPEAPVETDELADVGTETEKLEKNSTETSQETEETKKQTKKGGENK